MEIRVGVHLPSFRGRLGRSPGECRKGQHAPTLRKAAEISSPRTPTCQPTRNTRRSSCSPVCTSGSLTSGPKDDAEAPKATGRVGAVSRAGQCRSRPCGTDQAGDRCRHVCGRRNRVITAMHPSSCGRAAAIPPPPVLPLGRWMPMVPTHGDVIVSEGPGEEVLRGEDAVATNRPQSTGLSRPERLAWHRSASLRRPSVVWHSSAPNGRRGTPSSGGVPLCRNHDGRYRLQNRPQSVAARTGYRELPG